MMEDIKIVDQNKSMATLFFSVLVYFMWMVLNPLIFWGLAFIAISSARFVCDVTPWAELGHLKMAVDALHLLSLMEIYYVIFSDITLEFSAD